jgi:hypothetical protein
VYFFVIVQFYEENKTVLNQIFNLCVCVFFMIAHYYFFFIKFYSIRKIYLCLNIFLYQLYDKCAIFEKLIFDKMKNKRKQSSLKLN